MKLLKATTTEGKTEFFNPEKILTITPNADGKTLKILMGAGLYWHVVRESMKMVTLADVIGGWEK